MAQPLLAIDAPSVLFRAYYALPSSIKGTGDRPVNALLGSVNIVLREVLAHKPRAVVMCFGQDAADYRVDLFSSYHEDRAGPAPEGLDEQWEQAPDLFEALGWPSRRGSRLRGRRPAGLLCATLSSRLAGRR